MTFVQRLRDARERRLARTRGRQAALGLGDEPPPVRRPQSTSELRCARCAGMARVESLDLRTSRALVRCATCGTSWSTIHPSGSAT